jgi:hypothetical protein
LCQLYHGADVYGTFGGGEIQGARLCITQRIFHGWAVIARGATKWVRCIAGCGHLYQGRIFFSIFYVFVFRNDGIRAHGIEACGIGARRISACGIGARSISACGIEACGISARRISACGIGSRSYARRKNG